MNLLIPYVDRSDHKDPLFLEFTYGDVMKRGRKLKRLRRGDYIFFHHTAKGRGKCITAYYAVARVMATEDVVKTPALTSKFKSAHIERWIAGERNPDDVMVFGDARLSRILSNPLPFNRKLVERLSLKIRFPKGRLESRVIADATREWRELTVEDVRVLRRGIKLRDESADESDAAHDSEIVETAERIRAESQGLAVSPAVRKAIEDYAMKEAAAHFKQEGYTVRDVSKCESYDLHCKRQKEVLRVEVKGTQTAGDEIWLTPAEVRLARKESPHTALFVLHSVTVLENDGTPEVSAGKSRVMQPWDPSDAMLKPRAYSCSLPPE